MRLRAVVGSTLNSPQQRVDKVPLDKLYRRDIDSMALGTIVGVGIPTLARYDSIV